MYELIAEMHARQESVDRKLGALENNCNQMEQQMLTLNGHLAKIPEAVARRIMADLKIVTQSMARAGSRGSVAEPQEGSLVSLGDSPSANGQRQR